MMLFGLYKSIIKSGYTGVGVSETENLRACHLYFGPFDYTNELNRKDCIAQASTGLDKD